jgi:hypothetical protein
MPLLPPELIDYILDYLYDSPSNLRACALVCKAWVAPSSAHLFYKIEVDCRNTPFLTQLCAIKRTPSLAVYVRVLEVKYGHFTREIALELLPLFTRLRKLVLNYIVMSLEPEIRNSLHRALALPTLTHLHLANLFFDKREHFENLIHPHLKCLNAHDVTWGYGDILPQSVVDEEIQLDGRQPCHLQYLSVITEHFFINWVLGPQTAIDITSLRILAAYVNPTIIGSFSRIFQALRSLEHLHFHIVDGSFYPPFCQLILSTLYDRLLPV